MWTNYISFWDDLLDPMLVTIDGDNKYIIANPIQQYANGQVSGNTLSNGSTIRAKQDIYAASKRWLQRRVNSTYSQPMRTIGGDRVDNGLYAGDMYFVTNGWRIVVNQQINITGTIYNDTAATSPYIVNAGGGVIATVSSLAYAYSSIGVTVPTASEVASTVWNINPASYGASTAAGVINATNQTIANVNTNTQNILALSA